MVGLAAQVAPEWDDLRAVGAAEGLRVLVRPREALDGMPVIDARPVLDQAAGR